MYSTNPKVDGFFNKVKRWKPELLMLRQIVLDCGLTEELKWWQPCYTFQNSNVAIISGFKKYCVISFFKGALLKDKKRILNKPGENTQSARWIRFTDIKEIQVIEPIIKKYIFEAINNEKAGLRAKFKKINEHKIPEEFQKVLNKNKMLSTAFRSLTPGRQRAYLLYFSAPKQSHTRESRIEKCKQAILNGKGLNDH